MSYHTSVNFATAALTSTAPRQHISAVAGTLALIVFCISGCSAHRPIKIATLPAVDAVGTWRTAVNNAVKEALTPPTTPEAKRNLALSYSEALVMSRYGAVRNSLMNGRAAAAIAFDVANLGLTAAIPIVNGSRGKTILGAIATGLQGMQLSIDRNLFQQQTTSALLSAMDSCVAKQRRVLADHRLLPMPQYDEYGAYADLVQLYGCTTLAGAVQELTETQAAESRNTKQVIAPVSASTLTTFSTIQAAFIAALDGNKKAAVDFLTRLKVPGLSEASTRDELVAAYRGLLGAAASSEEVRQKIEQAARDAGWLKTSNQ